MNLVRIGPLTFDAEGFNGNPYIAADLAGWYSSPPMRVDADDRPNADGAFGSIKNYRSARTLRFEGHLLGTDVASAQEVLMDSFAAVQANGAPITISVENQSGIRSVTGSLVGEAEVTPFPSFLGATVTARFICPDPIKYGPVVQSATTLPSAGGGLEYPLHSPSGALFYGSNGNLGRVTITNSGTAATYPFVLVSGRLDSGFFIQSIETGQVVRYDRVVPDGTTVSINFRTGEVLIDGVSDGSTFLSRDEFFAIPAGGSRTIQFNAIGASSGTPTMTVTSQSGWW